MKKGIFTTLTKTVFPIILISIACYISSLAGMEVDSDGQVCKGCVSRLVLFPNQEPKEVRLPFHYKYLTPKQRARTIWVPELFYTTLNTNNNGSKFVVVGPCQPCLLIVLKNEVNGRVIVFHKHFSNSINSLIEIAKQELEIAAPGKITGTIFTNTRPYYATKKHRTSSGFKTWKDRHEGRTQKEELKFVKKRICTAFHIDNNQIIDQIFTSENVALGDYANADLSVFIDPSQAQLKFNSISIMHENILGNLSTLPLDKRYDQFVKLMSKRLFSLMFKHYFEAKDFQKGESYGAINFKKLGQKK